MSDQISIDQIVKLGTDGYSALWDFSGMVRDGLNVDDEKYREMGAFYLPFFRIARDTTPENLDSVATQLLELLPSKPNLPDVMEGVVKHFRKSIEDLLKYDPSKIS